MRDLTLFRAMVGLPPAVNVLKGLKGPKGDSQSGFFIEKGHLMEYVELNSKRIISLFFGPGEFAIQCHPEFANFQSLDDVAGGSLSHETVIRTLRKFPESFVHYREVRKLYYAKVAERLKVQEMPAEKRFEHLQKAQPWVFDLAQPKDIACYLGISETIFEKIVGGH